MKVWDVEALRWMAPEHWSEYEQSRMCIHSPFTCDIFTAHKGSLLRLCFYTCLSFCSRGGGGVRGRGACMVGGMCGWGGMHGRGACVVGEACMAGGCAWWWGACVAGGMCGGGGHAWWGACMAGACVAHSPPPPQILRETVGQCAGGTHPTGMFTCLSMFVVLFQLLARLIGRI